MCTTLAKLCPFSAAALPLEPAGNIRSAANFDSMPSTPNCLTTRATGSKILTAQSTKLLKKRQYEDELMLKRGKQVCLVKEWTINIY